jgi:hypothetical protein
MPRQAPRNVLRLQINVASWSGSLERLGWVHNGFLSGRLTSSSVAKWVLSKQDSNKAPQTSQDT